MYDKDIRAVLLAQLLADPELHVRESYGGATGSIADVVTVGERLECYEIKSDRDSLHRLKPPGGFQIQHYSQIFDRVTAVVARSHIEELFLLLPAWWGITVALDEGGTVVLNVVREARDNPELDLRIVALMLWVDEARYLARLYGVAKGCRNKWDYCHRLFARLTRDELRAALRFAIRSREHRGYYTPFITDPPAFAVPDGSAALPCADGQS